MISYFNKFKNLKCNYDVIEDLMNINEADQTYSLTSRTNSDNLMPFLVIQFLTAKSFHFCNEKLPLHMIFKPRSFRIYASDVRVTDYT